MGKQIRMSDIAKTLNVSTVTISKALSDKDGVSDKLRQEIKDIAKEMGYKYSSSLTSLDLSKTYNVGILIPEQFIAEKGAFYWEVNRHISKELLNMNYFGIMETLEFSDEQDLILPKMIRENKVDGLIVLGQIGKGYINLMTSINIPFIFLDFYENHYNIDTVLTDNYYNMFLLTNYLVEMGHKDIAYIGNYKATSSIQDRFLGYVKALIKNNIEFNFNNIISDRDDSGKFIEIEFPKNMPTAFVCNCDEVAYRVIKSLKSLGYKIPDDISVVGFDNYMISDICDPAITTIEVDIKAMADISVDTIIRKINNNCSCGRKIISGKLIIKDSVKRI